MISPGVALKNQGKIPRVYTLAKQNKMAAVLPLEAQDISLLPDLIKTMVKPEVLPLTIFSCHGYLRFLQIYRNTPQEHSENLLFGAYLGEKLLGFTEWRRIGDCFFLNLIYVVPETRGMGIGKLLFNHGLNFARHGGFTSIKLDIFVFNKRTIEWYESLGFMKQEYTEWYTGPNPYSNFPEYLPYTLKDLAQAEASQHVFGFSSLNVVTAAQVYKVGRIGDGYFRLQLQDGMVNLELLKILAHLDPRRSLLMHSSSSEYRERTQFSQVESSIRMQLLL